MVNRANAYSEMNPPRLRKALDLFEQAGKFFKDSGDSYGSSQIAMNRGNVLSRMGKYPDALAANREAARLFNKMHNRGGIANAATNRSIILSLMGQGPELTWLTFGPSRCRLSVHDGPGTVGLY